MYKKIDYVDLSVSEEEFDAVYAPLIKKSFLLGQFVGGGEVETFENNFAKFCNVKYAVSLNSGTDALIFGLKSLGVGSGDEVITVANSFVATANAIALLGAKPIFVDIGPDMLMDVDKIEALISSKTKVILPVHLSGNICDMDTINALAKQYKLKVIEDAAQSVGSKYHGVSSGALSDVGCFSLHPLKNLSGIGDGGIATTNDYDVYIKLLELRNHGLKDRDSQNVLGFNSRLDAINASVLNHRLIKLDEIIEKRRQKSAWYRKYCKDIDEMLLPLQTQEVYHTYHTFVVQVQDRDALKSFLASVGVDTKIHYPIATYLQKPFSDFVYKLEKTIEVCDKILSLPIANVDEDEIIYISEKIKEFYSER